MHEVEQRAPNARVNAGERCRALPTVLALSLRSTAALVALLAVLATGCASVPFDYPKSESYAIAPSPSSSLAKSTAQTLQASPAQSAFFPLESGLDALGARLRLMEAAQQTIDAQYFLIKGDLAGKLFTGKLLRAADRGVRVRFLVDDVFTTGLDPELSLLNAHSNIEVRLFNPLSRKGPQAVGFIVDFQRANRRMHNKSFTVDNVATIVGGRNIADEYFQIRSDAEFADFELLALGPVAAEVSSTFDLFWNSAGAVPMEAFGPEVDERDLATLRQEIRYEVEHAQDSVYSQAVGSDFLQAVVRGEVEPVLATARVVTDPPEKLEKRVERRYQILAQALADAVRGAEREVVLISPYFVPGNEGVAFLGEVRASGTRVVVVTNSLASTNHVAVHSGYAPYRKRLLEAGVELYEVRVDALVVRGEVAAGSTQRLTLHTKAAILDRETLFVGSLNLDPRSIDLNSEMGLFLDSPQFADAQADRLDADLRLYTYRVVLDDKGRLEWRYDGDAEPTTTRSEPQAGFWRRFSAGFYGLLPIEDQL